MRDGVRLRKIADPKEARIAQLDRLILNGISPDERAAVFDRQVPESSRAFTEIALGRIGVAPRRVTYPVLSVTAGRDVLVTPSVGRRLARRYEGDHLHFEDAAHYAMVAEPSAPEACTAIVDWIERAHGP